MSKTRRALVASAPTRLDFGGGWTDVPPYPEERGGFVCNLAIARRARVRIETASKSSASITDPLIAAALRRANVRDVAVSIESDFPVGAGLGGSSAAGVALAAALHAWNDITSTPASLAEWSRAVEVEELRIAGGRQDHYAAAFGGALGLSFGKETAVEQLNIASDTLRRLERRCLLVYTGESRISATTITAVLDAYRDRLPRVVNALEQMKQHALDMRSALLHGDLDHFSSLLAAHWVEQRALHPAITTARIDAIEHAAIGAGASGLKALGASGGGCVMVLAPEDRTEEVAGAVAPLATLLDWQGDNRGVEIEDRNE